MVIADHQRDGGLVVIEQAGQLKYPFSRHNHLAQVRTTGLQVAVGHGQAMAIGSHGTDMAAVHFQQ